MILPIEIKREIPLPTEKGWLSKFLSEERELCICNPSTTQEITSLIALRTRIYIDNLVAVNLIYSGNITTGKNKVFVRVLHLNMQSEEETLEVTPTIDEIIDHGQITLSREIIDICKKAEQEFIQRIARYK